MNPGSISARRPTNLTSTPDSLPPPADLPDLPSSPPPRPLPPPSARLNCAAVYTRCVFFPAATKPTGSSLRPSHTATWLSTTLSRHLFCLSSPLAAVLLPLLPLLFFPLFNFIQIYSILCFLSSATLHPRFLRLCFLFFFITLDVWITRFVVFLRFFRRHLYFFFLERIFSHDNDDDEFYSVPLYRLFVSILGGWLLIGSFSNSFQSFFLSFEAVLE